MYATQQQQQYGGNQAFFQQQPAPVQQPIDSQWTHGQSSSSATTNGWSHQQNQGGWGQPQPHPTPAPQGYQQYPPQTNGYELDSNQYQQPQVPIQYPQYTHPPQNSTFVPTAAPTTGHVNTIGGSIAGQGFGRHKIIVGFDFGTTYSGLAYADTTPGEAQISIIQNWPSLGNRALSQVRTEIAYPPETNTNFSWGYDIHQNLKILKWFKLWLECTDEEIKETFDLPPGMTILDITSDFMGALYRHAMEQLYLQRGRPVMEITQVDFVLTIPAVWNEQACSRTRQAAERAGFTRGHTLHMCQEPEAAALYTLRSHQTGAGIGDKIVVCDAGGGTVDLISYNIRQVEPKLEVDEAAVGDGDNCGSTFIDQAFEDFFKEKMGHHYDSLRVAQRQRVMTNFEEVKCSFRDRDDQETYSIVVPGKDNIPEAGIVDGEFEISRAQMRGLFDPIIDKIIVLIAEQLKSIMAADGGMSKKSVLLVGGFGQSPYLYKRVHAWAAPQGINVLQPEDGAVAVVKGAVLRGIDLTAPAGPGPNPRPTWVRKCRKHYGTLMISHFIPGRHLEEDAFIDPLTNLKMARNQISWFVYKGAPITDHQKVSQHFHRTFRKTTPWIDTLVTCEDDIPPTRLTPSVKILAKMTADMTHMSKRIFDVKYGWFKKIFTCAYQVDMTVSAGGLTFELVYKGVKYAGMTVEFQ